jgi:DNA-binding response OmpR family regulator
MKVCVIDSQKYDLGLENKIYSQCFCSFYYFTQENINQIDKNNHEIIMVKSNNHSLKLKKFVKNILERFDHTPILLHLNDSTSEERADYLQMGIKECISGKVCHKELLIKLSLLGENKANKNLFKTRFYYNNFSFCLVTKRALYKEKEIILNKKETLLLEALIKRKNTTVPRSLLHTLSWESHKSLNSNSLETHICSLRKKIEKNCGFKLIKTVWGVGYRVAIK